MTAFLAVGLATGAAMIVRGQILIKAGLLVLPLLAVVLTRVGGAARETTKPRRRRCCAAALCRRHDGCAARGDHSMIPSARDRVRRTDHVRGE